MEVDRWRILDFYQLFPELLKDFVFPADLKGIRRSLPKGNSRYRKITDPKRIFFRLEPIQQSALNFLASHKIIDADALVNDRRIRWEGEKLPARIKELLSAQGADDQPLLKLLTGQLASIDLYGKSGLRGRSDLFQYRYDVKPGSI